ncbi:hypothetical protein M8C21_021177 [Ambrosia artemisiifolia]|uniref:Uncharacterized protein n=1 Tax=Ambrosia artemisiifolia TaxID=4212 RepID=A0AAD5C9N7_AMBAR|nr:hypothetical protein M8C21_021177 [Ambrosia artemisiifolia]
MDNCRELKDDPGTGYNDGGRRAGFKWSTFDLDVLLSLNNVRNMLTDV